MPKTGTTKVVMLIKPNNVSLMRGVSTSTPTIAGEVKNSIPNKKVGISKGWSMTERNWAKRVFKEKLSVNSYSQIKTAQKYINNG